MNEYQTNIAGFDLDVETISDSFSKSIVKHEYPNTNGALLEDMGQKARTITIRCPFGAAGGVAEYADYFEFIKVLDDLEVIEFIHPEEGTLRGRIEKVDKRKNDRQEYAEVDVTFVEGRIEDLVQAEISQPGVGEDSFLSAQEEQQDVFEEDMIEDLGADGASAAKQALVAGQGILAQIQAASAKVRSYVAQVESAVNTLEATLTAITQPADTLLTTVNYALDMPGRVIGAVSRCVERYAESYNALRNFPARFQRSLKTSLDQLEASFRKFQSRAPAGSARNIAETAAMTRIANHIRIAGAHRLALEAAYGLATDKDSRLTAKRNETLSSFDLLGNYFAPVKPDSIMTRQDIEATISLVMTAAQGVIDLNRNAREIKRACASLLGFAKSTLLDAERIKAVDIDGTLPLHLILLKYGLPYSAADRVLAINPQIKHPNFVSGTINIYVL